MIRTRRLLVFVTSAVLLQLTGVSGQSPNRLEQQGNQQQQRTAKDRIEVKTLLEALEATLEQLADAHVEIRNVQKIFEAIDAGGVEATEMEKLQTNKSLRVRMVTGLRQLRQKAKSLSGRVKTDVLPMQRGVIQKLKTRWELEEDPSTKKKIKHLVADAEKERVSISAQLGMLDSRAGRLGAAIGVLETQLDYLDLVEESLSISRKISDKLRQLNQEIDKVLNALEAKAIQQ